MFLELQSWSISLMFSRGGRRGKPKPNHVSVLQERLKLKKNFFSSISFSATLVKFFFHSSPQCTHSHTSWQQTEGNWALNKIKLAPKAHCPSTYFGRRDPCWFSILGLFTTAQYEAPLLALSSSSSPRTPLWGRMGRGGVRPGAGRQMQCSGRDCPLGPTKSAG